MASAASAETTHEVVVTTAAVTEFQDNGPELATATDGALLDEAIKEFEGTKEGNETVNSEDGRPVGEHTSYFVRLNP